MELQTQTLKSQYPPLDWGPGVKRERERAAPKFTRAIPIMPDTWSPYDRLHGEVLSSTRLLIIDFIQPSVARVF